MTATKLRSVIDWLMFISTPQHSQEVINQVGTTIPTMNGTKPLIPSLRQLIPPPGFKQPVIVDGVLDGVLTPAAQTDGYKLLQSYLNGQLSWSAFAQQWDRMLDQQVAAWAQANHTDLSKYLK